MRMPKDHTSDLMLNVPKLIASGAVHLIGNFAPDVYTKDKYLYAVFLTFVYVWEVVVVVGGGYGCVVERKRLRCFPQLRLALRNTVHAITICLGFTSLELRFSFPTHCYSTCSLTSFALNIGTSALVINHSRSFSSYFVLCSHTWCDLCQ